MTRAAASRLMLAGLLVAGLLVACSPDPTALPEPQRVSVAPTNEGELRVILGGDTMIDDLALPWLLKYGWGYTLAGLAPLFQSADLVGLNLEVPVDAQCRRARTKKYSYAMVPEALGGLKDAGVDMVSLANNHFRDCGESGKAATVAALDRAGIWRYGAGVTEQDANRPLIVEVGGTTIGLIGMFSYSGSHARHGAAQITEANIEGLIGGLRPLVDVLIVSVHWGKNYLVEIDARQSRFGHLMIDAGADVVIGHGPHIPQAMELYGGKPLIYSVGNGAFATGNNAARESLLAELVIADGRVDRVIFHPLFNQNRNEAVKWQVRPATGKRARATLRKFAGASAMLGARIKVKGKTGVLKLR